MAMELKKMGEEKSSPVLNYSNILGEIKMMFKLRNDSFIRIFDNFGYIVNQQKKNDRIYDKIGSIFLQQILREPQEIITVTKKIVDKFNDVPFKKVYADFKNFLSELERNYFILTANSLNELNKKEANHEENIDNFSNKSLIGSKSPKLESTKTFLNKYFFTNPTVFALQIELTTFCNEHCLHCYIPQKYRNTLLTYKSICGILDQARDMQTLAVSFSGGEPMSHPDFIKILEYAREKDFSITILSNLTLLNTEILETLKRINVNQIQVSLYSMTPKIHDSITKIAGSFSKTYNAIKSLIKNNIPLRISCPLTKLNYISYKEVLQFGQKNNIKVDTDFTIMARSDYSTDNLQFRLTSEEIQTVLHDIFIYNSKYTQSLLKYKPYSVEEKQQDNERPLCGVGFNKIAISSSGNVIPCAGWHNLKLGHIGDDKLLDIWTNSFHLNNIRKLKQKDFSECVNCEAKKYCSICLLRNFNEYNGDMLKFNKIQCEVAFQTMNTAKELFFDKNIHFEERLDM